MAQGLKVVALRGYERVGVQARHSYGLVPERELSTSASFGRVFEISVDKKAL